MVLGANRVALMGAGAGFSISGGTETTYDSGGDTYKVHTFNSSGTLEVTGSGTIANILIIGGGGAGGKSPSSSVHGGGGGAGEYYVNTNQDIDAGDYTVTVGAGAPVNTSGSGSNGNDSSIKSLLLQLESKVFRFLSTYQQQHFCHQIQDQESSLEL